MPELWRRLENGDSGVAPIRGFDAAAYPTRFAAESAEPERPEEVDAALFRDSSRIERFAYAAAAAAIRQARLDPDGDGSRRGLALAAGIGSFTHRELTQPIFVATERGSFDGERYARALAAILAPRALERRSPGNLAARLASTFGLGGPQLSVDTACAAGTQAIGDAVRWLRAGIADAVVVVASDSQLTPLGFASFCLLRVLSTRNDAPGSASRPFSRSRDGFVMGEGAGALVLETESSAARRGVEPLAEVAGFGAAGDAFRVTDPHPDGRGAILAMRRALASAGAATEEVDYVNAHGTATPANDRIETRALHALFGEHARRLAVSSTKSMLGHLTVAAGAVEAIATIGMLRAQRLHPTANLDDPDPDCDLDYVPIASRPARLDLALSSSFGFGGQCAAVALRRCR